MVPLPCSLDFRRAQILTFRFLLVMDSLLFGFSATLVVSRKSSVIEQRLVMGVRDMVMGHITWVLGMEPAYFIRTSRDLTYHHLNSG
jgi:hypothetical protein